MKRYESLNKDCGGHDRERQMGLRDIKVIESKVPAISFQSRKIFLR